jgi:hypothetical protein
MRKQKFLSVMLAAAFAVTTLAVMPVSTPAEAQSRSPASCDRYARDYANSRQNTAGDLLGGAVVGAVGGALLGGIVGKNKVDNGLAIGAGVGALGGAANSNSKWQKRYNRAYADCMNASYQAPANYGAPPAGTPAWYDYCRAKYRSFNSRTGLYLSTSGQYKPCQ